MLDLLAGGADIFCMKLVHARCNGCTSVTLWAEPESGR